MSFEKAVSSLNELFFFKEFTFSRNIFRTQENNEIEFADNVVWLQDLLILYQVKERKISSSIADPEEEKKWFNRKVLKKGTRQIRDSLNYLNQEDKIPLKNHRGETFELSTKSLTAIDKIVLYYSNESLPLACKNCKSHRSKTIGLIHVISAQDYIKICLTLITPSEVHEYLQFREALIERYQNQVSHISEPALFWANFYMEI